MRLSSPTRCYFPRTRAPAITKLDLVEYYLARAEAALLGVRERPTMLKRFVDGVDGEFFFQKRVPGSRRSGCETATVTLPERPQRDRARARDAAHLVWAVNLGVIDFNPWPVRRADLDHPDELRVDLDPMPEASLGRRSARSRWCVRDVLDEHGLLGFPKTSGSRGIHVNVRIEPRWDFTEVRRAALALAREVERRMPELATIEVVEGGAPRRLRRLQPERARPHDRLAPTRCARCRTRASRARSRGTRCRTSSRPTCALDTVPGAARASVGDPSADDRRRHARRSTRCSSSPRRDEEEGLGDAPWPPHFRKQPGEPKRVQPSRARKDD